MKAGRVVVSEPRAGGSNIWFYEDGLLKNQVLVSGLGQRHQGPQTLTSPPSGVPACAQSETGASLGPERQRDTDTGTLGSWRKQAVYPWAIQALPWASVSSAKQSGWARGF